MQRRKPIHPTETASYPFSSFAHGLLRTADEMHPEGWTVIRSDAPFLMERRGYGILVADKMNELLSVSYEHRAPDVMVVVRDSHGVGTLVSLRSNGGVTVQIPSHDIANLTIEQFERLVCALSDVAGPLAPRADLARWSQSVSARILGTVPVQAGSSSDDETERELESGIVGGVGHAHVRALERIVQRRMRRAISSFVAQCEEDRRRWNEATKTVERVVTSNLERIKAELWRPDGALMARRFADLGSLGERRAEW